VQIYPPELCHSALVNKTFVSQTHYGAPPRITLGELRPEVSAFAKSYTQLTECTLMMP